MGPPLFFFEASAIIVGGPERKAVRGVAARMRRMALQSTVVLLLQDMLCLFKVQQELWLAGVHVKLVCKHGREGISGD